MKEPGGCPSEEYGGLVSLWMCFPLPASLLWVLVHVVSTEFCHVDVLIYVWESWIAAAGVDLLK